VQWVHWFNHRRPLEAIGNTSSAETEPTFYDVPEKTPLAE
jgi:transposase InsO family protein